MIVQRQNFISGNGDNLDRFVVNEIRLCYYVRSTNIYIL